MVRPATTPKDGNPKNKASTPTTSTTTTPTSKAPNMSWIIRILHEGYCWMSLLLIFPSYYLGGLPLFVLQTILGGGAACGMDWFVSPTMANNVHRIVERGYASNKWEVLGSMYLTILTSESITLSLAIYFTNGLDLATIPPRLDFSLVSHVLASLAVNELIFTTAHTYLLHGTESGGRFHAMHHCCRPSSFSTSFIFHFVDSNTEFTLTTVLMACFHHWAFPDDPFSLLVSLQVVYLWYTVADHSEQLRLPHYYHHHYISSNYSAYLSYNKNAALVTKYIRIGGRLSRDYVKEELQRSSKLAKSGAQLAS